MTRLALTMLRGAGRRGLVRIALILGGVAAGVALLLGAAAIIPAHDIEAGRAYQLTNPPLQRQAGSHTPYLLWAPGPVASEYTAGHRLTIVRVAPGTPGSPLPLGADRIPTPGTMLISPALRDLLAGPNGDLYRLRFGARVVGTLGQPALHDAAQLVAEVGVPRAYLARPGSGALQVTGWQTHPAAPADHHLDLTRRVGIVLGMMGILVPIMLFIAAATRIDARRREQRAAALRLVGATPAQLGRLVVTETAVAAIGGTILGLGLAVVVRSLADHVTVSGYSPFPSDLAPPATQVVAILVAMPALAILAAAWSVKRVAISPLGAARRAPAGPPSARRLLALVAALGLLWWASRPAAGADQTHVLEAIAAGFAAVIVAVALVGPWLVALMARSLAGLARQPATLLAGRRLAADPTGMFRAVSGVIVGAFVIATLSIYVASHNQWLRDQLHGLPAFVPTAADRTLVVVSQDPGGRQPLPTGQLRRIPGVHAFAREWDESNTGRRDLIAACPGARRVQPGVRCTSDAITRLPNNGGFNRIVPPRLAHTLPAGHMSQVFMATDGTLAALERLRAAALAPGALVSPSFNFDGAPSTDSPITATDVSRAQIAVIAILFVATCSLTVLSLEGILDRRRELAALVAAGTPAATLRRAAALEVALPVAVAAAASIAVAVPVGFIVLHVARGMPLVVPWGGLVILFGESLAAAAAVLAVTLPAIGRLSGPDSLRYE